MSCFVGLVSGKFKFMVPPKKNSDNFGFKLIPKNCIKMWLGVFFGYHSTQVLWAQNALAKGKYMGYPWEIFPTQEDFKKCWKNET